MNKYSDKTKELILKDLDKLRVIFKKEYALALKDPYSSMLYEGLRFSDDRRAMDKLEYKYTEDQLLKEFNNCLLTVLEDLASADYHYYFEKEW
jgi:exonuclease I